MRVEIRGRWDQWADLYFDRDDRPNLTLLAWSGPARPSRKARVAAYVCHWDEPEPPIAEVFSWLWLEDPTRAAGRRRVASHPVARDGTCLRHGCAEWHGWALDLALEHGWRFPAPEGQSSGGIALTTPRRPGRS